MEQNSLTPRMAEILMAIWEITANNEPTAFATQEEIARRCPTGNLSQRIQRIKLLEDKCLEEFEIFEEKRSSKKFSKDEYSAKVAYCLHPSIISLPKTANMIIELLNFEVLEAHLISREKFVTHIKQKYKWEEAFINGRLDAIIRSKYITVPVEDYLWVGVRTRRELAYISLVAGKYSPTLASEKTHQRKKSEELSKSTLLTEKGARN